MRIVDIRTHILRYSYPPELTMRDARYTLSYREVVLVEVEADNGQVGLGEAIVISGPSTSLDMIIRAELAPRLLGRDPFERERLWADMYYGSLQRARKGILVIALSGLDCAIWDLCARSLGIPLCHLLGGFRSRIPAYASGGFYREGHSLDELAQEMVGYVENGFRAIKMKIGGLALSQDIERVKAVRQAIGPDIRLMVDANRAYDYGQAVKMGRELEKLDVAFFEEPLPPDDIDGYRKLGRKLDLPLAAGENEYVLFGFRDLIDTGSIGVVQPDISWSGGITTCLKVAIMAEARHIEFTPHSFSSIVNLAGTLHLLGAVPSSGWLELDQSINGLRTDLAKFPLKLDQDGCIPVPNKPGIGVNLVPSGVESLTYIGES